MIQQEYLKICDQALQWAQVRNYKGYGKFDALKSPLLLTLSMNKRLLRGGFIYLISRMPINLRPALFVAKTQNPKGLALFAMSNFNLYKITNDSSYLKEGLHLLDMLFDVSSYRDYSGHCWGYDYPWQSTCFFIPPYEPNCVVTCFVATAFLQAYEITNEKRYLDIGISVANFILKDLNKIDVGSDKKCFSYDLNSSWKVINVNALIAALMANLFKLTQEQEYKKTAQETMSWVISQKTDYHAWYYTDPPEASHITHDNYHTGFVLDSIYEYLSVFPCVKIQKTWQNGLDFYKAKLFTNDHAPKWMHDKIYPHDIHGAAQGIITFAIASRSNEAYLNYSDKILEWTLGNLFSPKHYRFFYQKGKFWTKRFTLMRWSQAWMTYAISRFLLYSKENSN